MWILYAALGAFAFLFLLFLFLTAPGGGKKKEAPFLAFRYAHRGLHNGERGENTLSAFRAAADAGFAMELDVRVSRDGEVVVCHDPDLSRVAGVDKKVADLTAAELAAVNISGTGEGVPRFADVLTAVAGRVPILIEIKEDTAADKNVTPATLALLRDYTGPVVIESFNPLSLMRVRKLMPRAVRGLLCDHFTKNPQLRSTQFRLLQHYLMNFLCRPQFIAQNHESASYFPFRLFRAVWRVPTFAWTVRSEEEEREARAVGFDAVIFENYLPEDTRNHEI